MKTQSHLLQVTASCSICQQCAYCVCVSDMMFDLVDMICVMLNWVSCEYSSS